MASFLSRLPNRFPRADGWCSSGKPRNRRFVSRRLFVESLEDRRVLSASPPLMFTPRAIVQSNPDPVPPMALVAFDPQMVLQNLVVPGPVQIVSPTYRVVGSFTDTEQISLGPSPTTSGTASTISAEVTVSYNLQAQVSETITPPPPANSASANPDGALSDSYALWGNVSVQLVIPAGISAQPGTGPQTTLTYESVTTQAAPYTSGTISAKLAPIDPTGLSQTVVFTTQSTTDDNFTGTLVQTPGGMLPIEVISTVRAAVQDSSLANWAETLRTAASSTAVSSITASYTSADKLAESLWVNAPATSTAAPSYQISATDTGSGTLGENLLPGVAASAIASPSLVVTGISHTAGTLSGVITVGPSSATPPSLLLSEQTQGDGAFTGTLTSASTLLPTDPVLLSLDATQNVAVVLAGSVSVMTEGVNITNDSTAAAGIDVSGMNQVVGAIDGTGNLAVDAGSDLTADSIVQNTLTIGAGSTVTIAPSSSGGGMAANSSAGALAAITSPVPSAAVVAPSALVTESIATIPDQSGQVGIAELPQPIAVEPVRLAALTPIVAENTLALELFAANLSPLVSNDPLSIAVTATPIEGMDSTTTAYSRVALAKLYPSTAVSGSDAFGRSAVHAAIDAALEDGSDPVFAFDESLFDLMAIGPLKS